jgi:hypothetical protein
MEMKIELVSFKCIFLIALVLTGCTKLSSTPTPEDISNSLTITYRTGPIISQNDYVGVQIQNGSDFCIIFPYDYGTKIYLEKEDDAIEVANSTTYIGRDSIELGPVGDITSSRNIMFSPDMAILQISDLSSFYAEITGHLCDDESVVIKKKIPFVVVP